MWENKYFRCGVYSYFFGKCGQDFRVTGMWVFRDECTVSRLSNTHFPSSTAWKLLKYEVRCNWAVLSLESKYNLYYRDLILHHTKKKRTFFFFKCEVEPCFIYFLHKGNVIVIVLGLWHNRGYRSTLLGLEKRIITLNRFRTRASVKFTNLKQSAELLDPRKEIRLQLRKWDRELI